MTFMPIKQLPGLNALRFLAALSVLIGHVELVKLFLGYTSHYELFERLNLGGLGVYFFFVLSGFLITHLLILEKEQFNFIHLKNFYIRRILRIWPLYFVLLITGFFILPQFDFFILFKRSFHENFYSNLFLYVLMLPNLAFTLFNPVPHIGQLWSIGVEEQFYLIWPLLISRAKNLFRLVLYLLCGYILFKIFLALLPNLIQMPNYMKSVSRFFAMAKFECMLIGALGAVLLHERSRILDLVYSRYVFFMAVIASFCLFYLIGNEGLIQDGLHIVISLFFLIIIMNVSAEKVDFLRLNNSVLDYLGKISYGIYMYHLIVVFCSVKLFLDKSDSFYSLNNLMVYLSSFFVSIMLASLSYHLFENRFIKLKRKFGSLTS